MPAEDDHRRERDRGRRREREHEVGARLDQQADPHDVGQ